MLVRSETPLCYEGVLNRSSAEVFKAIFQTPCIKQVSRLIETEQKRLLKIFAVLLGFFAMLSTAARACSRALKLADVWRRDLFDYIEVS